MPLPPLPASNTPRGSILYTSGGLSHQMDLRFPIGTPAVDVVANLNDIIAAMLPCMDPDDEVTGGRYIPAGTNIAQPAAVTTGNGTGPNSGSDSPKYRASFVSMTGRSVDGRKTRVTFFVASLGAIGGVKYGIGALGAAYNAFYDAVIGQEPPCVTISGQEPIWNSYFLLGCNSYWQREQR